MLFLKELLGGGDTDVCWRPLLRVFGVERRLSRASAARWRSGSGRSEVLLNTVVEEELDNGGVVDDMRKCEFCGEGNGGGFNSGFL